MFFGSILVVQFVAMLFHRFGTLTHILASTEIGLFSKKIEDISEDAYIERHGANLARQLQKLESLDPVDKKPQTTEKGERRRTLHHLEESTTQKQTTHDLETAFRRRLMSITPDSDGKPFRSSLQMQSEEIE